MKILYIGDIMGRPGRDTVKQLLPGLIKQHNPNMVVAQAENVSHGKGISPSHMRELQKLGIDFFTGGNHSLKKPTSYDIFDDPIEPIIRPANIADKLPGVGHKIAKTKNGDVLMVSILGTIFPDGIIEIDNPLTTMDSILKQYKKTKLAATVVNFHGDLSSQKRMIGYYLDGKVTAVIGDHWHVPTADAIVLPKGTAHISDVGMCGSLHSSLGVDLDTTIPNWRDDIHIRHQMHLEKPYQFNAVLVETNKGLAKSIELLQLQLD